MNYNNEFSIIDTPEKAYFLGLFYADGCLSRDVSIYLAEPDKYLLENLKQIFPFFNLRFVNQSKQVNTKNGYVLAKQNKKLIRDILKNGGISRKSYNNKELLSFPSINKELYSSFIRGFFDGDGSAYTNKNRPNGVHIEFSCVSFNFISQLKIVLEEQHIECKIYNKQPNGKDRKQIIYRLYIIKSSEVIKFKEFIYADDTNLFLIRKRERLNNAKLLFDSRKKDVLRLNRNFICPFCRSKRILLRSIRKMKWGIAQRLKCKDCNKCYTIPYQKNIARFTHKSKDEETKPIN